MSRFIYTAEMIDWLRDSVPGQRLKISVSGFNRRFNLDKSIKAIATITKRHGIKTGMPGGSLVGERESLYTVEMKLWLAKRYLTQSAAQMLNEFNNKFGMALNTEALKSALFRNKIYSGRTGYFTKDSVSWNKGKKMPFNANSAKTQFKKGQLPQNTKFLGHERVNKDGYILLQVSEKNPHTGYKNRYVFKHHHVWKQANGPIPSGMCLKFIDSNRQNCELNNLMLISRAMNLALMRRGYDQASDELKPLIMTASKLQTKASSLEQQ